MTAPWLPASMGPRATTASPPSTASAPTAAQVGPRPVLSCPLPTWGVAAPRVSPVSYMRSWCLVTTVPFTLMCLLLPRFAVPPR